MIQAFIPLRGGSKSIPNKNIKMMAGKPLAQWIIDAATQSKLINKITASTDSQLIADTIKNCEIFKRSKKTATDKATSESALIEYCQQQNPNDIIIFLQATSPLIKTQEIEQGINQILTGHCDSAISVVRQKRFIWKPNKPNYDLDNRPRRQDWDGYFVENGGFYISKAKDILKTKCRISGNIALIECNPDTYYEIDEPEDWIVVESLLKNANNTYQQDLSHPEA